MKLGALAIIAGLLALATSACSAPDPATALHRAAASGRVDELRSLLDGGEDVNKVLDGDTPLLSAARRQRDDALAFLLDHGANAAAKDANGRDAWQLVYSGRGSFMTGPEAESLAVLVQHGFHDRLSLLEAATKGNSEELIRRLVERGADVKATDERGWTALHLAAFHGRDASCAALLQAGADVNAETTKPFAKTIPTEDGLDSYAFNYEAGSRPLDVAKYGGTKAHKSCHQIVSESGGTSNPNVKNVRGP